MEGILYNRKFSFHWGKYLGVGLHHLLSGCLTLSEIDKLFSKVAVAFYILISDVGEIWLLQVLSNSWNFRRLFFFFSFYPFQYLGRGIWLGF